MKIAQVFVPAALLLSLQGCAAAGLGLVMVEAGAGVGMGAGLEHAMNGIVYKTFTAPANEVRFAALRALDRLGMPVTSDETSEDGWKVTASATDRTIDVELLKLTEQTTRMRVVANEGVIFFKDASTATEIILQTAQTLQDDQDARAASDRNRKRKPS